MQSLLRDEFRRLGRRDRGTRTPAYQRLRDAIEHAIRAGDLEPGAGLPSERDLSKLLDLSRVTVRRAIAGLVEDGVLVQRHGAGTFVAGRIVKSISKLTSFSDDLRARGLVPRSEFLEKSLGEVTPEEAMALAVSPGTRVLRLRRIRYAGAAPLALERSVIPHAVLPDPAAVSTSLYEALDAVGCRPTRALQRLRAVAFDAEQARLLHVAPGSAGLFIERRSFLDDGRAVEFTCSLYRGDTYDFVAELHGDEKDPT